MFNAYLGYFYFERKMFMFLCLVAVQICQITFLNKNNNNKYFNVTVNNYPVYNDKV